jgi:hypothetical protein
MVEIEVLLAQSLGWSLHDIDETDVQDLLLFIGHLTKRKAEKAPERRVYADEVSWL